MNLQIFEKEDVWHRLQRETKPLVLYGTGNGAEKLLGALAKYDIRVSDIFVSDEFYRHQSFYGYSCLTYQDICQKYEDCIILIGFAVFRPEMLERIQTMQERYEVLAPEVPVFGYDHFTAEDLTRYRREIEELFPRLADETSKEVFQALLNYRLSGKLSYLFASQTPREEVFSNLFSFGKSESYVDLGAYRGDTIAEFIRLTDGHFAKILALEPDRRSYQKCRQYLSSLPEPLSSKITLLPFASWSKQETVEFDGGGGRNSTVGTGKETVSATDLDSLLGGEKVSFIKMDVEGAEAETLTGLKQTLAEWKPALAVSAYHKTGDLFTLPFKIWSYQPTYRIYLRHHPYIPAWETNYYCL